MKWAPASRAKERRPTLVRFVGCRDQRTTGLLPCMKFLSLLSEAIIKLSRFCVSSGCVLLMMHPIALDENCKNARDFLANNESGDDKKKSY